MVNGSNFDKGFNLEFFVNGKKLWSKIQSGEPEPESVMIESKTCLMLVKVFKVNLKIFEYIGYIFNKISTI